MLLEVLSDRKPKSQRELVRETGLKGSMVSDSLRRLWKQGYLLRTEKPIREVNRAFRGRAGISTNLRTYYLYVFKPKDRESIVIDGRRFVGYSEERLDKEARGREARQGSFSSPAPNTALTLPSGID